MPFLGGQISPSGQLRTPAATLIFVRFWGQSGSRPRAAEGQETPHGAIRLLEPGPEVMT